MLKAGYFAGLDVSLETVAICVVDAQAHTVLETQCQTDPAVIATALKPYVRVLEKVGHETGALTPWLHKELLRRKLPVVCLDARQTRSALAAQRNKTDRNDARDIAIALSRGFDGRAHVKSDDALRLRLLLTYRRVIKQKARDLDQALRMSVRVFGKVEKMPRGARTSAGARENARYAARVGAPLIRMRDNMLAEIKAFDKLVRDTAFADPICKRLMTAPGIGPITALTFKAAIDDPFRFKQSRLVGAHFGLTPRRFQSGSIDFRGRISRAGDKQVRTILFEAAMNMITHTKKPSKLRTWALKLRERRGLKYAAVACARKLAVIMHRMWVSKTDFCPDHGRF